MTQSGKYPTPRSLEELLDVFRQENVSPEMMEDVRRHAQRDDSAGNVELVTTSDSLRDVPLFERYCALCQNSFLVSEGFQELCPPESRLNICRGCENRLDILDDEASLSELRSLFTPEWFAAWRRGDEP